MQLFWQLKKTRVSPNSERRMFVQMLGLISLKSLSRSIYECTRQISRDGLFDLQRQIVL